MQRDACEKGMKGEGIGRADGGKGREELRDGRVPRPTPYALAVHMYGGRQQGKEK